MERIKISARCISASKLRALSATLPDQVHALSLSRLSFTTINVAYRFVRLVTSMAVCELEVSACVFTSEMERLLLESLKAMGVRTLFLDGWRITSLPTTLTSLSLTRCSLDDGGVNDLERAAGSLVFLNLSHVDLMRVRNWSCILGATHLMLRGVFGGSQKTFATFAAALTVARVQPTTLSLEYNGLCDEDLAVLEACRCDRLYIGRGNLLTDACLGALLQQSGVAKIHLDGAAITDEGMRAALQMDMRKYAIQFLSVQCEGVSAATLAWVAEINRACTTGKYRALDVVYAAKGPWGRVCDDMWREMVSFM